MGTGEGPVAPTPSGGTGISAGKVLKFNVKICEF